ncbi:ribonuclease J [Anaerosalibacter bizertensis]|uniref:Ribonuclease J n=1 Tax=Anaerosalibacter bizertensis TaxID=932217 RepID=A0A844FFU5_9FIRM|nr:ribonuclease J [Anaerosalibacter bizertensis]MBV1818168.1 ribonuclease J [Bacteroidales bacterium MSK.15.36]MCB5558432.1 ribonuclease J [Anaerosalibacter bizertensis]MCG4564196.1 ribonuclease J [Anaerosalibacter bizertensis]MCG4582131.1 ribonuclease J [Anaerosalibacter bizertensis]MSS42838.1 ribonuclease J [Anaerosalibacter bizertensis]
MSRKPYKLKIIPLGGLGEVGKNITVIEYRNDIIVIDCGLIFPEDEMLGIDVVIPDISYLLKNKEKVRAIVLTHGHEDHIGALPYVLKKINAPVYGTKLTLGLIENKLREHNMKNVKLNKVEAGDLIEIGCFKIEFIKTNHSIPDSVALAIHTPVGIIVHTGDFKIDYTPINDEAIDLRKFAEIGKKGVLALLADSTNVERPGYTMSERTVGDTFNDIFSKAEHRIIVATFASNVYRIQQIIDSAVLFNRKVVVSGRSMINVIGVATELGYLNIPDGTLIDINDMNKYPYDKVVVITTGSQGEPMSALARMAYSEHRKIELVPGDLVVISATPIPGNEKTVSRVINQLMEKGVNVIYESLADVHVSGHACQEELKLIHALVKPKYFIPVHGEYRHLRRHAQLAEDLGMPKENIFVGQNGSIIEFTRNSCSFGPKVSAGNILVDGLGIGDVGNIVLRDRKHLSEDGLIVVVVTISKEDGKIMAGPDIISRGFVYVRESEDLMGEARDVVREVLRECEKNHITDWATLKSSIRDALRGFLYEKIKRNPMILPIIMEV